MGFWHAYMGIEGGGGTVVTAPNEGWTAKSRSRLLIAESRSRVSIPISRERVWKTEQRQ